MGAAEQSTACEGTTRAVTAPGFGSLAITGVARGNAIDQPGLRARQSGRIFRRMSKAFTKESDGDDEDLPEESQSDKPLPAGTKNYITPAGLQRLQEELRLLTRVERPRVVETVTWAAGNGDRSENGDYIYGKKRLREIDRRVRFLVKRLEIAEVVDPSQQKKRDQVFFGATVTYVDTRDQERTIRIVGIDEARLEHAEVSWTSPVARALLKARVGDSVEVRTPSGSEPIEVLSIAYQES